MSLCVEIHQKNRFDVRIQEFLINKVYCLINFDKFINFTNKV